MARRLLATMIGLLTGLVMMTSAACAPTGGSVTDPVSTSLAGTGQFTWAPVGRLPITVYFAVGAGDPSTARIIVVMHGTERNADVYRDTWAQLITDQHVVVIVPEFSEAEFPGVESYNLGGVEDDQGNIRPVEQWTFSYLTPLFEETRRRLAGQQSDFDLFGHSAGAQFVHRFVEFVPEAPVRRAVAANAGWYTFPDLDTDFPYGLGGLPDGTVDTARALSVDLRILVGSQDTASENLRQDPGADAQGATRLARAKAFQRSAIAAAAAQHVDLRWSLTVVPGVEHDHRPMSQWALEHVFAR